RHAACAGVPGAVVGEVQRAAAAQIEGVHVVFGDLGGRGEAQPLEEAREEFSRAPRAERGGGGLQFVEPVEDRHGGVLQEDGGEFEGARIGGSRPGHGAPRSGNRFGAAPVPSHPNRLNRSAPSSVRNVLPAPAGPWPPIPGPPSESRAQNSCSCWDTSAPASSAWVGGMT